MAFKLPTNVAETTLSTGTGDKVLEGAIDGFWPFSREMADGDFILITITNYIDWEYIGATYNSSADSFTPTGTIRSTNGNAAVNWGVGTKTIAVANIGPTDLIDVLSVSQRAGFAEAYAATPFAALAGKVLSGCVVSNGADTTNDLTVTAGWAVADDGSTIIRVPNFTKQLDAEWAIGTNAGGRDATDSVANGTWFLFAIRRSDTEYVDLFMADSLSPTLPSGYDAKCLILPFVRDGGTIRQFIHRGKQIIYDDPPADLATTTLDTSRVLVPLTVPVGLKLEAMLILAGGRTTAPGAFIYVCSPDSDDIAPSTNAPTLLNVLASADSDFLTGHTSGRFWTDASGRVAARSSHSLTALNIDTLGYIFDGIIT